MPLPGGEMLHPDASGVLSDQQLLLNSNQLQKAIDRIDQDQRYSQEAVKERAESGESKKSETVPDVIAFGFDKLVYEYINALKVRFPKRKMILKTWERFWSIVERAPSRPYEMFRDLLDNVGLEMLEFFIANDPEELRLKDDEESKRMLAIVEAYPKDVQKPGIAKRIARLRRRMENTEEEPELAAKAKEEYEQLIWQSGLDLFAIREAQRNALPKDPSEVSAEDNLRLFEEFEVKVLRHLMTVSLFRLAKLDRVWCPELDLQTRDRNMAFAERLCNVTRLINGFDDDLKRLINSISIDSLKSVQGKKKKEIDINDLLDELQNRIMGDDQFLDKVSEIAMKQASLL